MTILEGDVDAYGTYARASMLADLLELQALSDSAWSREELADVIRDAYWTAKLTERFDLPAGTIELIPADDSVGLADEVDAGRTEAERVYGLLEERSILLADRYPFVVSSDDLRYAGLPNLRHNYLVLLAATLIHAYTVTTEVIVHDFFESWVTWTLLSRGYKASNLGAHRRYTGRFPEALILAGAECNLYTTPERAVRRAAGFDEGADVIAHFDWEDARRIQWVLVIQATVGKSDTWRGKCHEVGREMWRDFLGNLINPQVALAVPHHIEKSTLHYLTKHTSGEVLILDRIRLTAHVDLIDAEGEKLLAILGGLKVKS